MKRQVNLKDPKIVETDTMLGRMEVIEDDFFIGRSLIFMGEYSWNECEALNQLMHLRAAQRGTAPRFVDVGANLGFVAAYLAKIGGGTGIAFEPHPYIYQRLLVPNLRDLPVIPVNQAVGNEEGEIRMGGSFPCKEELGDLVNSGAMHATADGEHTVRLTTLDAALSDQEPVDLIKIDVEGMEEAVLRGARHVLERDRPVVSVEADKGQSASATLKYMHDDMGWNLYWLRSLLYDPRNYKNYEENPWGLTATFNAIGIHPEVKLNVDGFHAIGPGDPIGSCPGRELVWISKGLTVQRPGKDKLLFFIERGGAARGSGGPSAG